MSPPREPRRRPIADFLYFAREQPNAALAWTIGVIALVAVVVVGVFHVAGGSSHSTANGAGADTQLGTDGGATVDGVGTTTSVPANHPGTTTTRPAGSGSTTVASSLSQLGGGGPSTPATNPPLPPITSAPRPVLTASQQRWVSSPHDVTLKPGAGVRGWVIVVNLTSQPGLVSRPGCSGPPETAPTSGLTTGCNAGHPVLVFPRRDQKFVWRWIATSTGRIGGTPLAAGSYYFAVGPVHVHVTVT